MKSWIRSVRSNWFDALVVGLVVLYAVILWWPTRYLPFWWDAAGFVGPAANQLLENNFWPLVTNFSDFAHPPLLIILVATAWLLFGQSLLAAHLIMLPFLPLLLVSIYFLGKRLIHPTGGVMAAFLTGLVPVMVAQYGQIFLDLPAAALTLSAVAFWVYQRPRVAMVLFSLALLTKVTVILVMPLFIGWWYVDNKKRWKEKLSDWLYFVLPMIPMGLWLVHHWQVNGWWLVQPDRNLVIPSTISQLLTSLGFVFSEIFLSQGRWLLTLIVVIGLILVWFEKSHLKISPKFYILLGVVVGSSIVHAVVGEFTLRYSLYLIPLMLLMGIWGLWIILPSLVNSKSAKHWFVGIGVILSLSFINSWRPEIPLIGQYDLRPPEDMGYRDALHVFRQAAVYLEITRPNAVVYGAFPEKTQLRYPFLGYVSNPINTLACNDYEPDEFTDQIVYIHPYSASQYQCLTLTRSYEIEPLMQFESGGKWVELYSLIATQSAEID